MTLCLRRWRFDIRRDMSFSYAVKDSCHAPAQPHLGVGRTAPVCTTNGAACRDAPSGTIRQYRTSTRCTWIDRLIKIEAKVNRRSL